MATDYYLLDHHVSRDKPRKSGSGRPWYPSRSRPIQIGVIHTAENLPDFNPPDLGAENVAKYGATTERASWHDTVDSDSWVRMLPHNHVAFHVRNYNSISVGLEIATQAAKWVDTGMGWRLAVLENTARWVAFVSQTQNIPIRLISKADVDAGIRGFTFHSRLDPTRRTDPGDAFPWNHVQARAKEMIAMPPTPRYTDVDEWAPWAAASIESVIELGIMRGHQNPDGTMLFNPKDSVTREELAATIDRLRKVLS